MNDRDRFLDSFALLLQRRKSYEISKRQRNKTTINVRSMHERHYRHCHEQRGDYFTVSTNAFDKDEVKKQTSRERESGKKGIGKKKKKINNNVPWAHQGWFNFNVYAHSDCYFGSLHHIADIYR